MRSARELREIHMPLVAPFETSFGRTTLRRILLVEADVDGARLGRVRRRREPVLFARDGRDRRGTSFAISSGRFCKDANSARRRSWDLLARDSRPQMARGGVEAAIWDAEAQQKDMPLWKLLGGVRKEIPCGVSIGIQAIETSSIAKVEKELAAGYQRIKIKIKPGIGRRAGARCASAFRRIRLMVDANSAYTLADMPLLQAARRFHLMMIEQPLGLGRYLQPRRTAAQLATPICLDECIHAEHARAAIESAPARSSISSWAAWAASPAPGASTTCASNRAFRCGAEACSSRASAARTTSPFPRCRISPCPATSPPAALLGRGHHRAGGGSNAEWHDSGVGQAGNRICAAARPDRQPDSEVRYLKVVARST